MKFDLKQYVKVKDDKASIVLKHPKGHQVAIAKDALSPKMRGEFAAMPIHMYSGGEVHYFPDGGRVPEDAAFVADQPTVTDVELPQGPNPQIDEDTLAKRELYNRHILGNFDPGANIPHMPGITFGPNGEEPDNLNPDLWNEAENEFSAKNEAEKQTAKIEAQDIAKQNEARAKAGMKPLMVPPSDEASPIPSQVSTAEPVSQPTGGGATLTPQQTSATVAEGMNQNPAQMYQQGMNEQQAAIGQNYLAQTQLGADRARLAGQQITNERAMQQHFQEATKDVDANISSTLDDIKNGHINPNHYMENMGALGKVSTAIGLMLSGLGSGLTGQKNMAMDFLNSQIERDIQAQKDNLGKKDTLLSGYYKQLGSMKDAQSMALATQQRIYADQLDRAAAKATNPAAQAQLLQASGAFKQKAALEQGAVGLKLGMMQSLKNGNASPAIVIDTLAPESEKPRLHKDLEEAMDLASARDSANKNFKRVAASATVGDMIKHPLRAWSGAEEQQLNSSLWELSKEEGKPNEKVYESLQKQYKPTMKDTSEDVVMKMKALDDAFTRKMNKPSLSVYGITPASFGVMSEHSKNKIKESSY